MFQGNIFIIQKNLRTFFYKQLKYKEFDVSFNILCLLLYNK